MVSLTVLMIATFSETAEHASRLLFLKAGVGFAACAAIIALAAVMIITANKRITLLKEKANDDSIKRGMARSSVATDRIDALDQSHVQSATEAEKAYIGAVAKIDEEISKLQRDFLFI